jgi:membrane protease YdiL (CAAX protease family)
VKNLLMSDGECFTMAETWFGNFRQMDESRSSAPGETDNVAPTSPPLGPISSSGSNHDLATAAGFAYRVQCLWVGPDGLRPVWRFLIYLLAYRGLRLVLRFIIFSALPEMPQLWLSFVAELGFAVIAIAPALVMARIENRAFGLYGLPLGLALGKRLGVGAAWGILSISSLLLVMRAAGIFQVEGFALHGMRVLKFAAFWGLFFWVVAIYEEFFTRGYTQFTLTQCVGFWKAAVLLSVGFGVLHVGNPGETWMGILGAIAIGFFFCLTLRRTGNLWLAVGFHASWDWGESYLYSVPDSGGVAPGHLLQASFHGSRWLTGGSVGPEGSVFLFLLLALLWLIFDRVYPQAKYPAAAAKQMPNSAG